MDGGSGVGEATAVGHSRLFRPNQFNCFFASHVVNQELYNTHLFEQPVNFLQAALFMIR